MGTIPDHGGTLDYLCGDNHDPKLCAFAERCYVAGYERAERERASIPAPTSPTSPLAERITERLEALVGVRPGKTPEYSVGHRAFVAAISAELAPLLTDLKELLDALEAITSTTKEVKKNNTSEFIDHLCERCVAAELVWAKHAKAAVGLSPPDPQRCECGGTGEERDGHTVCPRCQRYWDLEGGAK